MPRSQTAIALLLLVIPLLLLPLQGHARAVTAAGVMPCTMHQHGMQDTRAMDAMQATPPCDSGSPCGVQCQKCAGCAHCPAGMVAALQAPLPQPAMPGYGVQAGQPFSSISLFKDHPPPRIG